jgi:FPC/CPF motif-containing protein YcgG
MLYYQRMQDEAADRVAETMSRSMPDGFNVLPGDDGSFDPWDIFPCVYGSYSSEFDDLAIAVLTDLRDKTWKCEGLAQEIFREMLCTANLCDYGTSPRACFATGRFQELLPSLIEKWREYARVQWEISE